MQIKAKNDPPTAFGQRSLASLILFRFSNSRKDPQGGANEDLKVGSPASFSEFLDRKLRGRTAPPGVVQGKVKPFSTLPASRDANESSVSKDCQDKELEGKSCGGLDTSIFKQFKLTGKENEDCVVEVGSNVVDNFPEDREGRESRKRRNPFKGGIDTCKDHVIVLGEGPKPKQTWKEENTGRGKETRPRHHHCSIDFSNQTWKEESMARKRKRPLYNHYANGGGFWDYSMEGVDSEEVGFNEVWEGVGSTSLGGIEWH